MSRGERGESSRGFAREERHRRVSSQVAVVHAVSVEPSADGVGDHDGDDDAKHERDAAAGALHHDHHQADARSKHPAEGRRGAYERVESRLHVPRVREGVAEEQTAPPPPHAPRKMLARGTPRPAAVHSSAAIIATSSRARARAQRARVETVRGIVPRVIVVTHRQHPLDRAVRAGEERRRDAFTSPSRTQKSNAEIVVDRPAGGGAHFPIFALARNRPHGGDADERALEHAPPRALRRGPNRR